MPAVVVSVEDIEPEEQEARLLVNKKELARKILNCSLPTLDNLIERYPDFPIESGGSNGVEYKFDAEAVVEYLRQQRELEASASQARAELFRQFSLPIDDVAPEDAKGLTPSQRMQLARARLAERKLAQESGMLVSVAEIRQQLTSVLARFGKFLDILPGQVGRRYGLPDEVIRAMRQQLDEQRRSFVGDLAALLVDEESRDAAE